MLQAGGNCFSISVLAAFSTSMVTWASRRWQLYRSLPDFEHSSEGSTACRKTNVRFAMP